AKAKTIEGYLGKDFVVKSSFGHVRDLAKKGLAIDVENNFKLDYAISSDKKAVVAELKKLAKSAEMVWLATDEDREGEAISWHLYETLKLSDDKTKRITFNEITKSAVVKAIENPRAINVDLVNAQQARRVLDRLVGFELSPVLWRKVKPSLSAGRVQSVAVRLIVEKDRSINQFEPKSSFKVYGEFAPSHGKSFKADLNKSFPNEEEAEKFINQCASASFTISSLDKRPGKKSPAAPFTTSTLQQEASRKLGYSVSRTMSVAQKLYEAGKITYMRTDSVNLSDHALSQAKEVIVNSFGGEYANPKKYQTKNKGAQEAHEAIRPTEFNLNTINGGDPSEKKLYELIWKRTLASQMADAELERTTVRIVGSGFEELFLGHGEVIKFDGFLNVYIEGSDDEDDEDQKGILPNLQEGESLSYNAIKAIQRFTRPPARYTEASLVKKMEELGIGRPSTYAPTISTVQKRGYVDKTNLEGKERTVAEVVLENNVISKSSRNERYGADKNKLTPTDIGKVVNDFLVEHFDKILDYNFTASVEKQFDEIANGLIEWTEMINDFYHPFHKSVETTIETSSRASGERILGEDPVSGKPVKARIGRFGPMVQIGNTEDEEKPRFASMIAGQSIDSIQLEEALKLFELPRSLGDYKEKEVVIGIGKYGPYIRYDGTFISIKKDNGDDPMTIELDRSIVLIEEKIEADKNKFINEWEHEKVKVQVLNGRYGPYIKIGKKNHRIPKGTDPKSLSLEDCLAIAEK
ncbi:MAG: type I DNA topoisomerase, partial [Crocinitomicaceae bacterium]|nr:type I DNA topoisomerase [Crocinitomicaceae bacterium]